MAGFNLDEASAQARAAGYTWDEIKGYVNGKRNEALAAGYTDDDINKFLGQADPAALKPDMLAQARASIAAMKPEGSGIGMSFLDAFRASSGGLLIFGHTKVDTPPPDGVFAHVASMIGGVAGDLPATAVGTVAGAAAGAAMTVNPVGAVLGGAMGGFGLPASIKANYADGVKNGAYKSPQDYAVRQAAVWHETAKAAATGAAMVAGGEALAPLGTIAKLGGEVATVTVAAKALDGQLQDLKPEDFLDNAIVLGGFKGVEAATKYAPMLRDNLLDHWVKTDEKPADAVALARIDESAREPLMQPPPPGYKEASTTPDADGTGDLVIEKPAPPVVEEPPAEPEVVPAPEATGKVTSFDPTAPDYEANPAAAREAVLSRVAPPEKGATLKEQIANAWMTIRKQNFDDRAPINDLTEAISAGRPIEAAKDPRILHEITRVSNERAQIMIESGMLDFEGDKSGPGLLEILKPHAKDPQGFWAYAVSRWAIEKGDQGKATGVDTSAAKSVVDAGRDKYGATFQKIIDWQNGTLSYLHESGYLSDASFDAMVKENVARVPGYREGKGGPSSGRQGGAIREFIGSEERIKHPLESLMNDAFLRVQLANTVRETTAVNDLGVEKGIAKEGPAGRLVKIPLTLDELERVGADQVAEGEAAIWRHLGKDLAPGESMSFRDGKGTVVKWDDPEIPQILKGYDRPTLSLVGKIIANMTAIPRAGIVNFPLFPIAMKIYDIPQQFITNPNQGLLNNSFVEFVNGFGAAMFHTPKWEEAKNRGVITDTLDHLSRDKYIQNVMRGQEDPSFTTGIRNGLEYARKAPLRALKYWANIWYQASEIGRMKSLDRKGGDPLRNAAEAAQSAFPQPGRGGSYARLNNQVIPFYTAFMNNLEMTARAATGRGQTVGGTPFSKTGFYVKGLALITLPVIASYLMNKDKDWYKNTPEWQKDSGLLFPPPKPGMDPLFLKYPPIISTMFGAAPRRVMDALATSDPGALTKGGAATLGFSFSPPGGVFTYNLATPIVEKIANYSFHRGAPLNPASMSGPTGPLPPEKFYPYTTETAKNIALGLSNIPLLRGLNMTPAEVDNFIQGWSGTIGQQSVAIAEKALGVHPQAPAGTLEDLPGASSFFARNTGFSAAPVKEFGATMDSVASVHASLGIAMADGNLARFKQLVQEHPIAAAMLPPSFGTSVRGLNAAGQASIEPQYLDIIRAAVGSIDTAGIGELMKTNVAVQNLRTMAGVIESVETPEGRQYLEALEPGIHNLPTPMSATDKRQLLDRVYANLVVYSDRGGQQARQLGLR